jgi:hypothetical protein
MQPVSQPGYRLSTGLAAFRQGLVVVFAVAAALTVLAGLASLPRQGPAGRPAR